MDDSTFGSNESVDLDKKQLMKKVADLREKGYKTLEISRMTGVPRGTVSRWLATGESASYRTKKCKTCQYRGGTGTMRNACDYCYFTGHSRGVPVEQCDKYIKGSRLSVSKDLINFAKKEDREYYEQTVDFANKYALSAMKRM